MLSEWAFKKYGMNMESIKTELLESRQSLFSGSCEHDNNI
jgi:hypothetical protein